MKVNGETVALVESISLKEFLEQKNINLQYVAVERNDAIVPKAEYDSVQLCDSDKLEIVSFVGGG